MQGDKQIPGDRAAIIRREKVWHDQNARQRDGLDALLYGPPAFDSLMQSSLAFLQGRLDTPILDLGCGEGKDTLALARQHPRVISVDLSAARLALARQLLATRSPAACVDFVQANAEQLPFASNSFELIHGKAILHHLDLENAAQEVQRLLLPDGKATFAEPMAHQPLFWLARRLTPKLRTHDEHPMHYAELIGFAGAFRAQSIEGFFLLAPFAYALRLLPGSEAAFRRLHAWLARLDAQLF